MPTTALHHVLDNVRMRHLGPDTPTRVSIIAVAASSAELPEQALDRVFVHRIRVRAQEAGEVVDVPAGEADEGFSFCNEGHGQ